MILSSFVICGRSCLSGFSGFSFFGFGGFNSCPVEVGGLVVRHTHRYPDLEVELAFYACRLPPGAAPRPLGVAALEWARDDSLGGYDFCEADRPVLPLLAAAGR